MKTCRVNKAKLSRTSTEKTRTGCITCKKRHVKCDEGRPHCDNCLNRGGYCEGYAARPRKKKLPGQLCWHSKDVVDVEIPSIRLLVDPDSLNPQDGMGMLYFLEFVSLAQSPWTSAVSNSDLWSTTLPQIARNNDTLRSAATAIGALSIWRQQSSNRPCCKVSVPSVLVAAEDVHYFHAVAYYCRALRLHQQQMSSQGVILLSILLLLFELLRGDMRAALDHVNHGLAMLLTSLMDGDIHGFVGDLSPSPKPLLEAVVGTFIYLTTNTRAILSGRLDKGPALPNLVKGLRARKQTVSSFITLLSRFSGPLIVKRRIPAAFESLEEFEEHWAAARRRQTTMSVIMLEGLQASSIPEPIDDCSTNRFFTDLCGNSQIQDFCKDSAKVVSELDTAFAPLFNKLITGNVKSSTYLKAVHLRLQLLGFYLFEDPPQMIDIESLQSQTPKYHEFLSLARSVIQSARQEITNPSHRVTLQCTLAWHLLIISLFCRDPVARDEAMRMLGDYPGQDGLWSTRGLYVLARRNCALERANAGEGTPEEQWRRLLRREFVFEEGGDRVVFRYLERNESSGQWDLVEEVAEVKGDVLEVQWKRRRPTGTGGLLVVELYKN